MILFNSKNKDYYKKGETKRRSLAKALTWRVIASLDTTIISYFLTDDMGIAISIGSIEILTKMVIYFFHERAWNNYNWGTKEGDIGNIIIIDSKIRSFVKATTWRILGTLDTITISYFLTGKLKTALSIGIIEIFTKMIFYFFHERMWNNILWGKRK